MFSNNKFNIEKNIPSAEKDQAITGDHKNNFSRPTFFSRLIKKSDKPTQELLVPAKTGHFTPTQNISAGNRHFHFNNQEELDEKIELKRKSGYVLDQPKYIRQKAQRISVTEIEISNWEKWGRRLFSFSGLSFIVMGIFIFRLLTMEQGVFHYFSKSVELQILEQEVRHIQLENDEIVKDIKLSSSSARYQRRMVRELLGVIAEDEYLIVFAQDP
jgi:hypothetical protein